VTVEPRSPRAHRAAIPVGILALAAALSGCTAPASSASDRSPVIAVSVDSCGTGWTSPTAGAQHFTLHNSDSRAGEVYLTDARTAAVYAEVDPLGPGTTATMDITLGSGSYAFRCAMDDAPTVVGPTVRIKGHVATSPAPVQAVAQADLIEATQQYQAYVAGQLPTLAALAGTLEADLARGDLTAARTDWLPAHLLYERLGAAYGAFGTLDAAINGLADGLPRGTADPAWTGFHRLEYGLWHGQDAATLRPIAVTLSASIASLQAQFAHAEIQPLELALRAHEITENALQFELTGRTDYGSGSNLATVQANLDGTATVLGILHPLLAPRYPQLAQTLALLAQAKADAAAAPSLAALSTAQREKIDADVSQLAEDLAPIATILEPRRVTQ
jgi:iron uptake system component EfeO